MLSFPYPRELRLRRRADYRRVQDQGRRIHCSRLVALVLPGESSHTRVGITVSRKVGNAVTRNRVKRHLREAIRHQQDGIVGCWDVVFIARGAAAHATGIELSADVSFILGKMETR
jgi:ribonuclease P protein component